MRPDDDDQSVNECDERKKPKLPPNADFDVIEWLEAETLEHEQRTQQMGYDSVFDRSGSRSKTRKRKKR